MVRAALRPSGLARRPIGCENYFARQITSDVNRARHFLKRLNSLTPLQKVNQCSRNAAVEKLTD